MRILKYKKLSKGKYKLFFDNGETTILHEDIIIKYNLLINKEINDNYNDIISDNNNYMIYDKVLKYISIKMRSEIEIRKYLINQKIDQNLIDEIILKLRNNNILNDREYVRCYILDKVKLNNYGLNKIRKDLILLKLDNTIIDEEISSFPKEEILINLSRSIDKKIKLNKSYGGDVLKQRIINELINKGYDKEDIINILNSKNLVNDELYNKEYNKLYNKYKSKYSGSELEYFIKQKLYSKGLKKGN